MGEELLFRGVLHQKMGIVGSNILFGLVHFVTPAYAVTAGLIGAYLRWVFLDQCDNLLAPILSASVSMISLAFLVVARDARRELTPPMDLSESA